MSRDTQRCSSYGEQVSCLVSTNRDSDSSSSDYLVNQNAIVPSRWERASFVSRRGISRGSIIPFAFSNRDVTAKSHSLSINSSDLNHPFEFLRRFSVNRVTLTWAGEQATKRCINRLEICFNLSRRKIDLLRTHNKINVPENAEL